MNQVHMVEPGGQGGVFQHAVQIAARLHAEGASVTLHTADDHELQMELGFTWCPCMRWFRHVDNHAARRVLITLNYVVFVIPHLMRTARGSVAHVQGLFKPFLTVMTLLALRVAAIRVVFSPHNTFSRKGSSTEVLLLRLALRAAHQVVVFSASDRARCANWGCLAVEWPLQLFVPPPETSSVEAWREKLKGSEATWLVVLPGQIRSDKGIDVALRSAELLGPTYRLAIVGEDKGELDRGQSLAATLKVSVSWITGYLDMNNFLAATAAADVVIAPYSKGSQSAVLSVANSLHRPTVASDVGGLGDAAAVVVPVGDAVALAAAIREQVERPRLKESDEISGDLLSAAYGSGAFHVL